MNVTSDPTFASDARAAQIPASRFSLGVLVALLTLIFGAFATWTLAKSTQQGTARLIQRALQDRATRIENRIVQRLLACEALLYASAGFVENTWPLTEETWRSFTRSVERAPIYPGLQGIGFAVVLERAVPWQVQSIEDEIRRHPSDRHGEERTAILYLEPLDVRNQRAIGFDMMSEPVRREAMERARDNGQPAMSGKVTLVQEIDSEVQPGFLMYLPVYAPAAALDTIEARRTNLLGFVYSPFRATDFLSAVLTHYDVGVQIHVYDGPRPSPRAVLYVHGERGNEHTAAAATTRHISVAGREWTLEVAASEALIDESRRIPVWVIVAAGSAVTLLLSGLMLAMAISRRRLHERLVADEKLLEQERDAAVILENSLEAFIVIDEQDRILEWNKQASMTFGWDQSEVLGRELADVIVPESMREAHLNAIRHFHSRDHTILGRRVEMPAKRRDGSEIIVALSVASVVRRDQAVFFASIHDVTARRLQEERVRQLNATLELRVSERTRELEEANRRLEMTNRDLSAFTRSVSHDLRAPLRAIKGYSGLLAEDLGPDPAPRIQRDLDAIAHTTLRMEAIIDDLLKLASVGQQDLKLQAVPMLDLARRAIEDVAPPEEITIHVQEDLGVVCVDPGLFLLALRNLLANAIKFSRTQPNPSIWIGNNHEAGERVYFVRDNGVGFDEKYVSRLFGAFQRLHTAREFEGTGLGLTIVKSVIEKHRGRVWASSGVGQGATFFFVIPEPRT